MNKVERLTPLAGVGLLVFLVAGFALGGDSPDTTKKSAAAIAKHYADQGSAPIVGFALIAIGLLLYLIFASHIRQLLANAGEEGVLPRVAFAGVVIVGAGFSFDSTLILAMHEGAGKVSPTDIQALSLLYDNDFIPMATGTMIFLVGIGVPILRSGALPKWTGAVAILLAIISFTPIGFVGFIGSGVLAAVLGVLMFVRAGRAVPAAA